MGSTMMRAGVFLTATLAVVPPVAGQSVPALPPDLDEFVEEVISTFDVPGAAVAIVKDGQVVMAKGYGVRTIGSSDRVDARTRFAIASNTKAFTATALGLLVEEGVFEWDEPVIRYLPWFRMSDPYVTAEMTVRDLLVHRSGLGLGAGDLLWWPETTYERDEIVRRLGNVPLATSFRSAYAYDNLLYIVAGQLIEAVSGDTWEAFVRERILQPLGMTCSNAFHSLAASGANNATPHARVDGIVRPVAPMLGDNTNAGGGINSCADDLSRWLSVQLDSGLTQEGIRLFSPATTRELWKFVTPMPLDAIGAVPDPLHPNFRGYALGFRITDYRGMKLVSHTGELPGNWSKVAMLPELRAGVAVLLNQESDAARNAIVFRVLDHFLDVDYDWIGAYLAAVERRESAIRATEQDIAATRDSTSIPTLPLEHYTGVYRDAWYGTVSVELEGGELRIRFDHTPALTGTLDHWEHDTFVARWDARELRADAFLTFTLRPDGRIDRARMRAVSPRTDFSFDFHDLDLRPTNRR
jgi:CubicO group peptidase (beta-lactamase class C family)